MYFDCVTIKDEGMGVVVGGSDDMLVGKRKMGVDIVSDITMLEDTRVSEKTGVISTCVVGSTAGSVVMGTMVVSGVTSKWCLRTLYDTGNDANSSYISSHCLAPSAPIHLLWQTIYSLL